MSGPTITMCPTMANPDAIDSVAELREELHLANARLMRMAEQMHAVSYSVNGMSEILASLLVDHMAGRHDAVKAQLEVLAARHVKLTRKPQGGPH